MTDNTYCPLCRQILEADNDLFSYLRKQHKSGEVLAIASARSRLPDVGELFKGASLTSVGGGLGWGLGRGGVITWIHMFGNRYDAQQQCFPHWRLTTSRNG